MHYALHIVHCTLHIVKKGVCVMYKFNGFTEKANNAINLAIESAQDMGHTYIGSEHILLVCCKTRMVRLIRYWRNAVGMLMPLKS